MYILIADDDASMRAVLKAQIERTGGAHTVYLAESGEEALGFIRRVPLDLLITDFLMPGMNGLELLRRARAIKPTLAVILMSGMPPVTEAEAIRMGAIALIHKGNDPTDRLVELVNTLAAAA